MIELLIAISILVILTGMSIGSVLHYRTIALEKRYMVEAGSVFDALDLVLTDRMADGTYDEYVFWEDFGRPQTCDKFLEPYLSGKRTKGSKIYRMLWKNFPPKMLEIEYIVDGYTILVVSDGSITIISRPN